MTSRRSGSTIPAYSFIARPGAIAIPPTETVSKFIQILPISDIGLPIERNALQGARGFAPPEYQSIPPRCAAPSNGDDWPCVVRDPNTRREAPARLLTRRPPPRASQLGSKRTPRKLPPKGAALPERLIFSALFPALPSAPKEIPDQVRDDAAPGGSSAPAD